MSLTLALPAMAACSDPARPGVRWEDCDLSNAVLSGLDLSGAELDSANLTGATWYDVSIFQTPAIHGCR